MASSFRVRRYPHQAGEKIMNRQRLANISLLPATMNGKGRGFSIGMLVTAGSGFVNGTITFESEIFLKVSFVSPRDIYPESKF